MVALVFFVVFFVYLPFKKIKVKGMEVVNSARLVKDSFKKNDIDQVKARLDDLDKKYALFQKEAKKVYWMSYIPFLGSYITDFKHGVSAGDNMIKAAIVAVDAIVPYADLIGFKKGGSSFVEKSADERIQTAVLTLDKMLVKIDTIVPYVEKAREDVNKIKETRYPVKIGKIEVRKKIASAKEQFEGIASLFIDAKPFLKKLPQILGSNEKKKYLVLFQNDKELRPTGGFLTNYAVFYADKGKFNLVKSEDIYSLDGSISFHPKAPKEILTYHKDVSRFYIRDSNLSPDFVKSIELFNSLYEKSSQKIDYDGVIAVDTYVLVDALKILGDTTVDGIVFSARKDGRCNCPQVIYKLFDIIDRPVAYIKTDRKAILGHLLYSLMEKALGFSPSQYWGKLSQMLIKNLQGKHILVYFKDKEVQRSMEKINFAGRIRDYNGDYLHINDTNFAGAKSNLFVSQSVVSETNIDKNGKVRRKVTITYKNPYRHSDCNLERGGLCLNATLPNWLRIYVPKESKLIRFQGSETKVNRYQDLRKTVFEGFLKVNPLGKAEVIVEYELPFIVFSPDNYRLLIQKQPGTENRQFKILVNGKKIDEFNLTTDKEVKQK